MRIALLFEFPTVWGGERSMLAVVDWLRSHSAALAEAEFTAIAPGEGLLAKALSRRCIPIEPLRWHHDDGTRRSRSQILDDLLRIVERRKPDLVHANSLAMGRLTGAVADRLGCCCTAHLRDILRLSRSAVGELNGNHRLLAVSQATRRYHAAQGVDAERIEVVYNGVDPERFQPRPKTGLFGMLCRVPPDATVVLTIGQIGLRKGQDVLAEAAARIAQRRPGVHFVIVGERTSQKAESRRFEESLHSRFREAGLAGRVHWLGYREDVPALMNEADLLVHAAREEPLGRVLLEAAASGLPVIATDVGGTREIFAADESARLVAADDADELARAIVELADDPARRRRMAVLARRQVQERFRIDQAATKLAAVWCRAVCGNRADG